MSVRFPESAASPQFEIAPYAPRSSRPANREQSPANESDGIPWARYADAVKRHALLILAVTALGSGSGFFLAKRVKGVYEAQTTVWITPATSPTVGPIQAQRLLPEPSWVELVRSFAIVDAVVIKLHLNVSHRPEDAALFEGFVSKPGVHPGNYVLTVEGGGRYALTTAKGVALERGMLGDSVGRALGFGWAPSADSLARRSVIAFGVITPRAASLDLLSRIRTSLPDDGQFLKITLSGSDPRRTADILNAWTEQFVSSSGDLKKRHLLEFKRLLAEQLNTAERELRSSEIQLEQFRINTITLPSDGAPVAAGGIQATRDPVITNFFAEKQTLSDVRNERVALERVLANSGGVDPEVYLMMPGVLANAPQLRAAIDTFSSRQAALRSELQYLTEANPRIKQLREGIRVLQVETIPQIARGIVQRLREREEEMNANVQTQSQELRAIPSRTIEEMRLTRQVAVSENLYTVLRNRYEEVSLAEAQTTPDLSILDVAITPTKPSSKDAPRLFLLAIVASVGFAVGIALLHDRMDGRFRYPDQATNELGLTVAGTVPRFKPGRGGDFQLDVMSQAVESFRTLRLALQYEFSNARPLMLSVCSPCGGDGKSLVSSNLALAFAGAGYRTLLIDGDVRRGSLHSTFDIPVTPGLVDYLSQEAIAEAVVKHTAADNLFIVPRGKRGHLAPQLLLSDQMGLLLQMARQKFHVVIIDSPPFIAGVDAYALGAAAGNMLIVLRPGASDLKLAAAKLEIVDRLPIRIVGAVINGVPMGGVYKYYGTGYGDEIRAKESVGSVATPGGLVVQT